MRRTTRVAGRAAVALAATLTLAPAHAETSVGEPDDGTYLRLDAPRERHVLVPGDSVRWRVDVNLEDPPSPAEIGLRIGAHGPLADVPGGMTLIMHWCETPTCSQATTVLPTTPASALTDESLSLDGLSPGALVVTAAIPSDAPDAAQGKDLQVTVGARAHGLDEQSPPVAAETPPARLPTAGAAVLAPALLATASVLAGLGLAAARRRFLAGRPQKAAQ